MSEQANAAKRPSGLRACADGLDKNPDKEFALKCMRHAADRMEELERELTTVTEQRDEAMNARSTPTLAAVDLPRLVRPSCQGYWWWLPAYAIQEGKGHLPQWWIVISAGPDTEKEGEFVGPLTAPIWSNPQDQERNVKGGGDE